MASLFRFPTFRFLDFPLFVLLRFLRFSAVMNGLDLLHRDQASGDHLVELGQEFVDLLFTVDDLDHQRQIVGEAQDFCGMHPTGPAEAHGTSQDGGSGEMLFARR